MRISKTTDYEIVTKLNETVQDLHAALYPQNFKPFNEKEVKSFFRKAILENKGYFLLLEDNEEPVGYAWIELKDYKENPFKFGYHSVYIHQICIRASDLHKGYGKKLMDEIDQIAKTHHIKLIELDYWVENQMAQKFYQKRGFIKSREFVYKMVVF